METRMMRPRLVIVEDDQDNLEALSLLLAEGYEVFGYLCPTEALKAVETVRPDLLVLDIRTAPIDGLDCLKLIRAIPGYLDVPAVAFTGFGRDAECQSFLAAGFQAVVVKPVFDPREMIAVIERVLASRTAAYERIATYPPASAQPPVARLDLETTRSASFARGLGKEDEPAAARRGNERTDENAG
jgi:CheY-like chemotaxis protein